MQRSISLIIAALMILAGSAQARPPHSIRLGKAMHIKLFLGPTNDKVQDALVRPLMVDGNIREFTIGPPHDVTDELFVIQRAYRLNDALPDELQAVAKWKWKWQKGTWLLVNRNTGRITRLKLPDFDPYYSEARWYQDYAAYCGLSSDANMLYAVIYKIGEKDAMLDRELRRARNLPDPDSECAPPDWQRLPPRVTFLPAGMQKVTFEIKGHSADPYMPAEAKTAPAGTPQAPPPNPQ